MTCTLLFATLALLAAHGGLAAVPAAFEAGAARVDITPDHPVYIAGYEADRRSNGVADRLHASALALRSGGRTVVLVSADLLGLTRAFVDRVRARVPELAAGHLWIACTHTHSGPDTYGQWGPSPTVSGVEHVWMSALESSLADVARQALAQLRPARLRFASTHDVSGISYNARAPGVLDTELAVMQVRDAKDGSNIAVLVNYACHPEIMHSDKLSADFPGVLCERLQQRLGGVALYFNAAQGGMITAVVHQPQPGGNNREDVERVGGVLADKTIQLLAHSQDCASSSLSLQRALFQVPLKNPRFEALIHAGVLEKPAQAGEVATEVCQMSLGPAQFVTVPGEALPDIGLLLKQHMRGHPRFVLGLCNDGLGYILSGQDYGRKLYAYETSTSVGPDIGPAVVRHLLALMSAFEPPAGTQTAHLGPSSHQPTSGLGFQPATWFKEQPRFFKPEKAKDMEAVYQFHLTGPQGGSWNVRVSHGTVQVAAGTAPKPDVTFTATVADWGAIVDGKLDAQTAFLTGRLKMEGSYTLATRFDEIFGR